MIEKLVLVIFKNRMVTGNDGEEHFLKMYFLQLKNGNRVPVKPCFNDGYTIFKLMAEVEYNDSPSKEEE